MLPYEGIITAWEVTMDNASLTELANTNWNEEWKRLQIARKRPDDASFWDERSKTYVTQGPNRYVERFLALADIRPHESIFDMGCGTGALSLPLGERGHDVIGADFSPGMLSYLIEEAQEKGLTNIQTKVMSWSDDWESQGVTKDSVDVAIASRSIATADLEDSLMRLNQVARRRVHITIATGSSPRVDDVALHELGISNEFGKDFVYAFNILVQHDIKPEVSYIESHKQGTFDSFEDAYETYEKMVFSAVIDKHAPATQEALKKLTPWIEERLTRNPTAGELDQKGQPQKAFILEHKHIISWAFVAWNVKR